MRIGLRCVLVVAMSAAFFGCVTAPREGGAFRIVSYNIRHGEGMDKVLNIHRTGRVIAAQGPRFAVDSEASRLGSIDLIRQAVAACGPKPVFLSGDWNASPDSSVLKALKDFVTVISGEDAATSDHMPIVVEVAPATVGL